LAVVTATLSDVETTAPTVLRLALFGGMYEDTVTTGGVDQHYLGRIKSDVVFNKKIGLRFWEEDSGIDFGYLDIAVEDQDLDLIEFAKHTTIATVDFYRVNLTTPSANQLEILASAQTSDIAFENENTIRLHMDSILADGFEAPINDLYYDDQYPHLAGKPYPIAWAFISDPQQLMKSVPVDGAQLLYHVTDVVIDSFESDIYDRGIPLTETTHFIPVPNGFILNQNPSGELTSGRILIIDPEDTGNYLQGLFRFVRLAMTRAGLWPYVNEAELTQLENDIAMGIIFPQYFTTEVSTLDDFLEEIFGGVTGWYYVDELAEIHFGRLTDPDAESAPPFDFTDSNMIGKIKVEDDTADGLSSRIAYAFSPGCYTESDIAGDVYGEIRLDMTNCWRIIDVDEVVVKQFWTADAVDWTADDIIHTADGYAGETTEEPYSYYYRRAKARPPIDLSLSYCEESGLCDSYATGLAEINRWWSTLYYKRRRFYTFDVKLNDPSFNTVLPQLGDFVTIQSNRFRLINQPKNLFVRRLKFNFAKNLLTIEGWG
jgi:hypothetical protein